MITWLPSYFIKARGMDMIQMGWVVSVPWVGALIGSLVGGWIVDHWLGGDPLPVMRWGSLATAGLVFICRRSGRDGLDNGDTAPVRILRRICAFGIHDLSHAGLPPETFIRWGFRSRIPAAISADFFRRCWRGYCWTALVIIRSCLRILSAAPS